ncbi:unnamed protein product [Auanema sp. JU1783]|nr:unnamed protein product [Auanema sp. JU1783]
MSNTVLAPDGLPIGNRVWVDGCYDLAHYGHANQIRQAKQFGKYLIVGVHSDEEIIKNKGPILFEEEERYRLVASLKWVDEIVRDAPYCTTVETLDKYNCDFCVHGDDITLTADGKDTYGAVKAAKRYRECKRTTGVSTTDMVGRILLMTKAHHVSNESMEQHSERTLSLSTDGQTQSPWTRVSQFIPTTQAIFEFAEGKPPKPSDRIVYCCGSFDLFNIGHLSFLEEAAKLGDYLIVGILSDQDINKYKGSNYPIMALHERVLNVLAHRPVNEVIIGAPPIITEDFIRRFNISVVAEGTRSHDNADVFPDQFDDPIRLGIYTEVESHSDVTTETIINRIIKNRLSYEQRNNRKEKKELAAFNALQKLKSCGQSGTLNTIDITN